MPTQSEHPSRRFKAPPTILAGTPLKTLVGPGLVRLLAESVSRVFRRFDAAAFRREALEGLSALGLLGRGEHVARALRRRLPADFPQAAEILVASMGPELARTEGNGLAPFFYLPHSHVIALFGVGHFREGMKANYELTKRFSAEFSVRPFLERYPDRALAVLRKWASDPNPHVRRLVSEGSRPRLPWAPRLPRFQEDPAPVLSLLELLKDDPSLYVRRSVANSLGDVAKDHPGRVFERCRRWLDEIPAGEAGRNRRWLIRHAVRLPARKGVAEALRLRRDAVDSPRPLG